MVNAEASRIAFALLESNLPARLQVGLICDDNNWQCISELVAKLFDPVRHFFEAIHVGNIVDNQGALRVTVVNRVESVVLLLARGVPNAQLE